MESRIKCRYYRESEEKKQAGDWKAYVYSSLFSVQYTQYMLSWRGNGHLNAEDIIDY